MMRSCSAFIAVAAEWTFYVSAHTGVPRASGSDNIACAQIASSYSHWVKWGDQEAFPSIPGHLAYDCLRSMPFQSDRAVVFLNHYREYLKFHSTLDLLKNPPSTYLSPAIDISAGLDKIQGRAVGGKYSSQFDFDWDLNGLLSLAHDGHLQVGLCSLNLFSFTRNLPLVSVSEDGVQRPELYTFADATLKARGISTVSPVAEIDGMDAVYFLESRVAMGLDMHDPDARYNRLFPSAATRLSHTFSGGAWTRHKGLWPGAATFELKFSNGSHATVSTLASWTVEKGPMVYETGEALFKAACLQSPESAIWESRHISDDSMSVAQHYPEPEIDDDRTPIKLHYLDATPFEDLAILQVPSFRTKHDVVGFSQATERLLQKAKSDGKTKLIIDVSDNHGGDVGAGLNLYRQILPDGKIYSATRFRANDLVNVMGQIFSKDHIANSTHLNLPLIPEEAVNPAQEHVFKFWEELYGPREVMGSNMSNLYAHFDLEAASTAGYPIHGYGTVPKSPKLFETKNIVMLTNGCCASTCALFVQQMRSQGVKTIAFGGRPRHGPMQAVGGNRGAQYWSLSTLGQYMHKAHELARDSNQNGSKAEDWQQQVTEMEALLPPLPSDFPLKFDMYDEGGINFRNAYDEGDDETPLQFKYEAADYRRFFTLENVLFPGSIWRDAAEVAFGDG